MQIGIAHYGRRRPVELTPKPTVCPFCGTDLEKTVNCPDNCPEKENRHDHAR